MSRFGACVLFALISCLVPCAAHAAPEQWTEVKSPHFRVLTDGTEGDGRKVAYDFEQMRYVLRWRFPEFRTEADAPLMIVAVRNEAGSRKLQPTLFKGHNQANAVGVFYPNWDHNLAAVQLDGWTDSAKAIVYHEYTHSVLHLNAHWLPTWMDEGLAEFFAYTRFENNRILIGAPTQRWRTLMKPHLLPVSEMLDDPRYLLRDGEKTQMFYAEAWVMVHYMIFNPDMKNGTLLSDYFKRIQHGEDRHAAFTAVFGSTAEMDRKLDAYTSTFLLNAGVAPPAPPQDPKSFETRKLSAAETLSEQGIFHLGSHDVVTARTLLQQAIALDPKLAQAHQELGFVDYQDGRLADARSEWQTAYSLDPLQYRSLFATSITGTPFRDQTPEERKATIEQLRKVVHTDLHFAPAYTQLAYLFWWQGDLDAAVRAAGESERLEPWRAGYHMLTARLLLAQNKGQQAAVIARRTAELYTGPDRNEAVELWQQVPTNERGSGPELLYDFPAGATVRHGTLLDYGCSETAKARNTQVRFQPDGSSTQPLDLTSSEHWMAGYTDTLWAGGGHFNMCKNSKGHQAIVAYSPTHGNQGDLLWVHIQEDLPASAVAQISGVSALPAH